MHTIGKSALHYCVSSDACAILIHAGANVHGEDNDGLQPLHVAASSGCSNALKMLVGAGADVNRRTHRQCTPLHFACMHYRLNSIRTLLALGADPFSDALGKLPIDMLFYPAITQHTLQDCLRGMKIFWSHKGFWARWRPSFLRVAAGTTFAGTMILSFRQLALASGESLTFHSLKKIEHTGCICNYSPPPYDTVVRLLNFYS